VIACAICSARRRRRNVNAHGLATDYVFQYGTTSGYGGQTPLAPAGSGTKQIKVSQAVTGLQPDTIYHYRIVAVSLAGTTNGKDHTFTTAKVPLSLQIEVTNVTGGFSFPFPGLLENAQLRVMTVGKPAVTSPVVLESVAVRVSFHVRRARRHGYVRLYGAVAPAEVGALVGFQLLRPGGSVNVGGTTTLRSRDAGHSSQLGGRFLQLLNDIPGGAL